MDIKLFNQKLNVKIDQRKSIEKINHNNISCELNANNIL